jgi:hypothetical protein
MAEDASTTDEWARAGTVETRRFACEVIEEDVAGAARGSRLRLERNDAGQARLVILVPPEQTLAVRKELFDRGYRGGLACRSCRTQYGNWRNYLNELEVAHIVVEMLGWSLTPEEQAMLDAVDDYGRRAPTGFRSPRLAEI